MNFHEKLTPDERFLLLAVMVLALGALGALTLAVRGGHLLHLDQAVLGGFHKLKNPSLDRFFSSITWLGSLWVLLPAYVVLVLSLSKSFEHVERVMGIGFFGAIITTYVIKYLFERKRPHFFGPIGELPLDPAFPSAHTTQIIAFSLLLWIVVYTGPTLGNLVLSAVLLGISVGVVLSRMYLQVHFPTDVVAGTLIALIWAAIAVLAVKSGAVR
ncbi:MAG: phosphatase PAP2 family protein [Campylobacterota bacterium]